MVCGGRCLSYDGQGKPVARPTNPKTGLVKRPVLLRAGRNYHPQTGKNKMTDKTAIQRIKELDHERATLFEQAKEEALRLATQAVEDLNALGLKYRLVEGASPAASKDVGKTQQKGQAEKKITGRLPG
jgi:hypothetical protein